MQYQVAPFYALVRHKPYQPYLEVLGSLHGVRDGNLLTEIQARNLRCTIKNACLNENSLIIENNIS